MKNYFIPLLSTLINYKKFIKTKNELEEIIRCCVEIYIDYITKDNIISYCNEDIKNNINLIRDVT